MPLRLFRRGFLEFLLAQVHVQIGCIAARRFLYACVCVPQRKGNGTPGKAGMISGRQRALKRLEQAPVTPIEDQYGASHIHKTTASQQAW